MSWRKVAHLLDVPMSTAIDSFRQSADSCHNPDPCKWQKTGAIKRQPPNNQPEIKQESKVFCPVWAHSRTLSPPDDTPWAPRRTEKGPAKHLKMDDKHAPLWVRGAVFGNDLFYVHMLLRPAKIMLHARALARGTSNC